MSKLLRLGRPFLAALIGFAMASISDVGAQNVVVNGDFSDGDTGWTVYNMQPEGSTPAEVFFEDTEDCPTEGSPGGCVFMFGTGALDQVEVLIFQEITLIAGVPYVVDAQFRYLAESAHQNWAELYLGNVAPVNFQNWLGHNHWGFNWWEGCSGLGVDGLFSEHACTGRQTHEFIPPGEAGTELTYYVGIKSGMWQGEHFAVGIDDVTVAAAGGAFAVADFSTEPSGRALLGESITFDASSSTASGTIVDYEWDFGDGNTGSGASITHTYAEKGQYDVTLTVTTDEEISASRLRTVVIWDGVGLADNPLQIPLAPAVPEIDGIRESIWDGAQVIEIATRTNGAPPSGPDDLSASAWLMWDPEAFYILFEVTDDDLNNDSGNTWDDDAPEFYLDGGNEKDSLYDDNDQAWELGWNDDAITGRGVSATVGAEMASRTWDDGTGYSIEVKMPWENIGVSPGVGDMIGFEAAVNDDDEGGPRSTKLAWFAEPGNDNAWQWAYIWGNAILVETISTATEPRDQPGRFTLEGIYPNPFNPSTTALLNVHDAGGYTVQVFDMLGRLVRQHDITVQTAGRIALPIELGDQSSGTYLIRVRHNATGKGIGGKALLIK